MRTRPFTFRVYQRAAKRREKLSGTLLEQLDRGLQRAAKVGTKWHQRGATLDRGRGRGRGPRRGIGFLEP